MLVIDGPVTWDINGLLADFAPLTITPVELPENVGLALALNAGLRVIETPFVFRMDADDVATPERFEKQLAFAHDHDSRFVCSWHQEFGERTATKKTPTTPDDLHRRLMWHNIVSHPTILVETTLLKSIGGYRSEASLMEDYDLYLRLRAQKVRFDCIGEALVLVRTDGQSSRRAGFSYLRREANLRWRWSRERLVPAPINLASFAIHTGFRLAPSGLRSRLFRIVRSVGT